MELNEEREMKREFWQERWASNRIGFHRESVNPNLTKWWSDITSEQKRRVLVPLCGKSLDLNWLSKRHSTVGVELSRRAIENFIDEHDWHCEQTVQRDYELFENGNLTLICGDFLELTAQSIGTFDAFFDRAAIVALPQTMRVAYVNALKSLIKPGGRGLMVTLEYDQKLTEGPPFSVPVQGVKELFSPEFDVQVLDSHQVENIPPRFFEAGINALTEHVLCLSAKHR